MKRPALREVIPVTDFRADLARWIRHIEKTRRPVVLTQQGKAAAVLVSPDVLDEIDEEREVVRKVLRGLTEIRAGKLVADEDVWKDAERTLARSERRRANPVE
jgi:prevent-host-death family protein